MKISIDVGSFYIKAARLSLEGFPMMISDANSKANYTLNKIEKVDTGFLIGYEPVNPQNTQWNNLTWNSSIDKSWPTEALMALIVKKVKADSDAFSIAALDFVIPVGFGEQQKNMLAIISKLVDVPKYSITETPIATIAHHRIQNLDTILVVDWGYSGLRISIVSKQNRNYKIVAHQEIVGSGGKDFTQRLSDVISANFEKRFSYAIPQFQNSLARIVEQLKIELSSNFHASQDSIIDNELVSVSVSRRSFELSIKSEVETALQKMNQFITESGFELQNINAIILSGGCTMIPYIKNHLKNTFSTIRRVYDTDPITSAVLGAAIAQNDFLSAKIIDVSEFYNTIRSTAVNGVL